IDHVVCGLEDTPPNSRIIMIDFQLIRFLLKVQPNDIYLFIHCCFFT
ncbi:MAG: hypothetical protein ACI90V_004967, partial [Bacillariaceae sp.]